MSMVASDLKAEIKKAMGTANTGDYSAGETILIPPEEGRENTGDYSPGETIPNPVETAIDANSRFGTAVKEYLEANCEITYAWVGVNPSGVPDPVVTITAKPIWVTFPLLPAPDLTLWAISLSTSIFTAIITPEETTPPFVLTGAIFAPIPLIITPSLLSDPDEAMLAVCTQIINGIKLMISPIPVPGVHALFTGSATMSLIQ